MFAHPGVDLALVATSYRLDVVLNDLSQSVAVVDVLNPLRQLRVPKKGMTSNLETVLLGKGDNLVGASKVELATLGLSGIPLHAVLGGDLPKVGLDDGIVLFVFEEVGVGNGAIVLLAFVDDELVDVVRGLTGLNIGGDGRDQRGCEEERGELHDKLLIASQNGRQKRKKESDIPS